MNLKPMISTSQKSSLNVLRVRTDLRAGGWRCNDCSGKVMGNQLFKPVCAYCEKT